ncbi:RraA family protein [Brevundimonas diminuta]|uniref:RraA family protein n=1 Tax=Brevundimonas diminuta TaxID=293 RepID=UPI002097C1ED|nr:RraA family protein [Brevundimonas diminuta]MCO8019175.1 RraA family protein [Brevundimonas diminuta]MCO8021852.1 RraA family protein [Brevundimonas diminuta]
MTDANVERARRIDTATLSDALDKLGIAGQCLGIKPLDQKFRLAGRAFTLSYAPVGPGGTVGDFIDDVPEGAVVAIDNGGRPDATVWGDILTLCAHRRGLGGTVIDGACRDTSLALELGYPMYSRSYSMRTGKDRVQLEATQVVVNIGDARVRPGDILVGDSDGVIAIPHDREGEVLDTAEAIDAAEMRIRDSILAGERLDEARRQQSYHLLQRREQA